MPASYGATASEAGSAPAPRRVQRAPTGIPPSNTHPLPPYLHSLSSCFLHDFEHVLPTTLTPESPPSLVRMYVLRHSPLWKHAVQPLSAVLLFLSSFMEDSSDDRWTISLSVLGCLLLSADLALWASYSSKSASAVAHTGFWAHVSALFIVSHLLEIFMYRHRVEDSILVSSSLKPAVLFYLLPSSESSLVSFLRVLPSVTKINLYLLGLIFLFSCGANQLFGGIDEHFGTLFHSFLTMFALSTSVNNPSCWIRLYNSSKWNALFFVCFLLLTYFFIQKIYIAVILEQYNKMAAERLELHRAQRQESLALSFAAIARDKGGRKKVQKNDVVQVLKNVRPHYGESKIEALWQELAGRRGDRLLGLETYKERMPGVIAKSIHRRRNRGMLVRLMESGIFDFLKLTLRTLPGIVPPLVLLFSVVHECVYVGEVLWKGRVGDWLEGRGGEG
ncbi:hypothetical protein TeGR_g11453, partial [Tetraparma gracilis]